MEQKNTSTLVVKQLQQRVKDFLFNKSSFYDNHIKTNDEERVSFFYKDKLFRELQERIVSPSSLTEKMAIDQANYFISYLHSNQIIDIKEIEPDESVKYSLEIATIRAELINIFEDFLKTINLWASATKSIYICYNVKNNNKLIGVLKNELPDYNFLIRSEIDVNNNIANNVHSSIQKADAVLALIDETYSKKNYIYNEISEARQSGKPIIFIKVSEKAKKPNELFYYFWVERFDPSLIRTAIEKALYKGNISAHMLSDHAIDSVSDDLLGFDSYAGAIQGIIDNPSTGTPLSIVINAPWGAGKSSLGQMVMNKLKNKPAAQGRYPHIVCWFNAWMHDDSENLSSSYLSFLLKETNQHRSWWKRLFKPLPVSILSKKERINKMIKTWFFLILFSFIITYLFNICITCKAFLYSVFPEFNESDNVGRSIGTISIAIILKIVFYLFDASKKVSSYINDPSKEAKSGRMEAVRNQVKSFIDQALPKGSRLVIFIDDLERCHPPTAIDLLEINNQILSFPNVVTVLMADVPLLATQAEIKYKLLAEKYTQGDFGRVYLQKIIQLQFDIPVQSSESINDMVEKVIQKEEENRYQKRLSKNTTLSMTKELFYLLLNDKYIYPWEVISLETNIIDKMSVLFYSIYFLPVKPFIWFINNIVHYRWKFQSEFLPKSSGAKMLESITLMFLGFFPIIIAYSVFFYNINSSRDYAYIGLFSMYCLLFYVFLKAYRYNSYKKTLKNARENSRSEIITDQGLEFINEEKAMQELADDSVIFSQTRDYALRYLSGLGLLLPRNAKRITNKIRLALFVLHKKGLLDRNDPVFPRYLAKWVIFQEKWPELYQYIFKSSPEKEMKILEAAIMNIDRNMFTEYIKKTCVQYEPDVQKLTEFFISDQLLLSEKIEKLCYLTKV